MVDVLDIALDWIWWWGSSPGVLGSVEYPFIAITPRPTESRLIILVRVSSMDQINLKTSCIHYTSSDITEGKMLMERTMWEYRHVWILEVWAHEWARVYERTASTFKTSFFAYQYVIDNLFWSHYNSPWWYWCFYLERSEQ